MNPKTLPKVNSTRFDGSVVKSNRNAGYVLFDGDNIVGVIIRPRNGKRTWGWALTGSYTNGYVVGQQAAVDALVKAYEQTLEAQS